MIKTAIFDLDGTIISMPKRNWADGEFNWENFMNWMDEQDVIPHAMTAHEGLLAIGGYKIIVVTARPEKFRKQTEKLLERIGFTYDSLIMRPSSFVATEAAALSGCSTEEETTEVLHASHAVWRESVKQGLVGSDHKIIYAFDDQLPNLAVWNSVGANCYLATDRNEYVWCEGLIVKLPENKTA